MNVMGLNDEVTVQLEVGTVAILVAGLYSTYGMVEPEAVPSFTWIELAEKLVPFLEKWNYNKFSLEQWIQYCLLIIPLPFLDPIDLEMYRKNDLYFESDNGNVVLVVTADMSEVT